MTAPHLKLGPFDLERAVGRGAMGEVWLARHRVQGVEVAIKLLHGTTVGDPWALEAFRNEVRAVADLSHAGIVAVVDHGIVPGHSNIATEGHFEAGTPYLVMEFVGGRPMNRFVGRLSWSQIRSILLQLLDALAHSHARGVVHRDLKPGNVLLTHADGRLPSVRRLQPDEPLDVKLTDFGLAQAVDERTRLIALTHVPTSGGLVNPAEAVGQVARDAGVFYLLDACQSAGQLPLDVRRIGCDFLSFTGRKYLRGPRGSGMLYASSSALQRVGSPLTCDGNGTHWLSEQRYEPRPDARRFETYEHSMAAKLGLTAAIELALELGVEAIESRVKVLAGSLRASLEALPGVRVHDQGIEKCGIVTFTSEREAPHAFRDRAAEAGINLSITQVSSSQWSMATRGLEVMSRASVHYYNNTDNQIARNSAMVPVAAGSSYRANLTHTSSTISATAYFVSIAP